MSGQLGQALSVLAVLLAPIGALAAQPLATDDVAILGVSVRVFTVDPDDALQRPRNVPIFLETQILDAAGRDVSADPVFGGFAVKGRVTGRGVDAVIATRPGQRLEIGSATASSGVFAPGPPLLEPGTYTVDELRLVDATGATILDAEPSVFTIRIIDRVLVSNLTSRPLSLEEIRERGIVIGDDDFTAYSFTFGLGTESDPVTISFDAIFPQDADVIEGGGGFPFPPEIPALEVPSFDAAPLLLQAPIEFDGVRIPPIPGVLVIPGNIAFLHQFFEVVLLVSNVTPPGSRLVITEAAAELILPRGENGYPDDADDPLAPAETEEAQALHPLCEADIDPLLCAALHNTETGGPSFGPGENGEGLFLVEGIRIGTHRLEVTIKAQLSLPDGTSVPLQGKAFGTVLVRHPKLSLSINHPDVVRAGETYSVFITIHNIDQTIGAAPAQLVTIALDPKRVSGATLVGSSPSEGLPLGTVRVDEILPNDAATVEYRFIARKNGKVTAAAFAAEAGADLTGGFIFRTGVGDLGIPLSPDTLVLPPYVHDLPEPFMNEALRVLGLAHSVSTAPRAQNTGLAHRISTSLVKTRALELAEAGLRVRIGDAMRTSLLELWLDWVGNQTPGAGNSVTGVFDPGFDEILRRTDAGNDLERALANEVAGNQGAESGSLLALHEAFGAAESYRGRFASVVATGSARIAVTGAAGAVTQGCAGTAAAVASGRCPVAAIEREVEAVSLLGFDDGSGLAGEWMFSARDLEAEGVSLTVAIAGTGTSTIAVLVPGDQGFLRRFVFADVDLAACGAATLSLGPPAGSALVLSCGGAPIEATSADYADLGPTVVGVRQIPEADPLSRGRVVAVLFDQAVDPATLTNVEQFVLRYHDLDNPAAVGLLTSNRLKRYQLLPRGRILFLNFFSSVSRFFDYDLTVKGVADPGGHAQAAGEGERLVVVPDFVKPLGGIVQGTVRGGNGEPLASARVELRESFTDDLTGLPVEIVTGAVASDANGFYRFDFVGDGNLDSGREPFRVVAIDPDTGRRAERQTVISFEGQLRNIDLVLLGLGRVTGHVIEATTGLGVEGATVTVHSLTDATVVSSRSGPGGSYTIDNVGVGSLFVTANFTPPPDQAPPGEVLEGSVGAELVTAGDTLTVDITVYDTLGIVEGMVYEAVATGSAPQSAGAGVHVALFNTTSFVRETTTDAAGSFRFPNVPEGPYSVKAVRQGTAEQATRALNVAESATTFANIILPGTARIIGKVLRADGGPAAFAEVIGGVVLVRADAHGNFTIEQVGTGPQPLRARDPGTGAEGIATVDVGTPGDEVAVTITLEGRATIRGTLTDATSTPLVGREVFLWRGSGFLRTSTGQGGRFAFMKLELSPRWILRAGGADGAGVEQAVPLLVHGQEEDVPLQLTVLRTIRAVVVKRNATTDALEPTSAPVTLSIERYDSFGRLAEVTETIASLAPTAATNCTSVCDTPGTLCGVGTFSFQVPTGARFRIAVEDQDALFAGQSAAVSGSGPTSEPVPGEEDRCLVLGEGAAVEGTVFLPDGTMAGDGVLVTYRAGANEQTQPTAGGKFVFSPVAPGPFRITARDPLSDNRGTLYGTTLSGDRAIVDVNLLGQGQVTVTVRDGTNALIEGARVELKSGSPVAQMLPPFATLFTDSAGQVTYDGVPEGRFSVTAEHALGEVPERGSAGGEIFVDGQEVTVPIGLGESGRVFGHITDPQDAPVGFAEVRLSRLGQTDIYTSADELGNYAFEAVPIHTAPIRIEFFDPRTGRIGFESADDLGNALRVDLPGAELEVDLSMRPVGHVTGVVTRPAGAPITNAKVELRSAQLVQPAGQIRDASFFGPGSLRTTTNLSGAYVIDRVPAGDFTVKATDSATGAMGSQAGFLSTEAETVTIDVTVAGRAAVRGTARQADGLTPVPFAAVTLTTDSNQRQLRIALEDGTFSFDAVPLEGFSILARAQGGHDGGTATGQLATDGDVAVIEVVFIGTGAVSGTVFESDGASVVPNVPVVLTGLDATSPFAVELEGFTDAVGGYAFTDVPTGAFSVVATDGALSGTATGVVAGNGAEVDQLDIRLGQAGRVFGRVVFPPASGGGPVAGALVVLTDPTETNPATRTLFMTRVTGADGVFELIDVPVGLVALTIRHGTSGFRTAAGDLAAPLDPEEPIVLDFGDLELDDSIATVLYVSPANGAAAVDPEAAITITFSEPVIVPSGSIKIRAGTQTVPGTFTPPLNPVGGQSSVTFVPNDNLPQFVSITVDVSQQVRDLLGRPIAAVFRSVFQTRDDTEPEVVRAILVRGQVVIEWTEPVTRILGFAETDYLKLEGTEGVVAGLIVQNQGGRVVTFKPHAALSSGAVFALRLEHWVDTAGNDQTPSPFTTGIDTLDATPPVISVAANVSMPATVGQTVVLKAIPAAGVDDVLAVDFRVGGQVVGVPTIRHPSSTPSSPRRWIPANRSRSRSAPPTMPATAARRCRSSSPRKRMRLPRSSRSPSSTRAVLRRW